MKIEIELNQQQAALLLKTIEDLPQLDIIHKQLNNAIALADDSQKGEIPKSGDNEIIGRSE